MQKEMPFAVVDRDLQLPVDCEKIIAVTGVRRCGKSSMLKLVANQLLERGVDRSRILWINFDDERLDGMQPEELDEVIQGYREMYPDNDLGSVFIFFDEIQSVEKWELFVLRLYKIYCKNIYISGSNAKMLSSQISTALRGWPLEYEAYTLSFKEYLRFKRVEASKFSEEGRAKLAVACREYLRASSFPEVVLTDEESMRIRILQSYFNAMLFRDIIEHYSITNPEILRYLLKRVMGNLSKPTSINAIYNDLKSQGRKTDKNRLYEYVEMACETFMFFRVTAWSKSQVKESARLPKYYCADTGMRNAVILPQSDDNGKLLENAVFLHLKRSCGPDERIFYFQEGAECDFAVQRQDKIAQLVQVCWTLEDKATLMRELRGLKCAAEATGCEECLIITMEESNEIDYEGLKVAIVPAWRWMLE